MEVIDLVLFTYVVFTTKEHHVRKILAGGNVDCAALLEDDDIALRRGRALKVALVADVPVQAAIIIGTIAAVTAFAFVGATGQILERTARGAAIGARGPTTESET
jgi:hypothetical protein